MARTFSSNLVIFAGPSPATGAQTGIRELVNITDAPLSFSNNLEAINVFGTSVPVAYDSLEPQTVTLDLTWNGGGLHNEKSLGFNTDGGNFLSGILNGTQAERNIFYARSPEGTDAVGVGGADLQVIGIGNAIVNSYSVSADVGSYLTASTQILGYAAYSSSDGVGEPIPSIDRNTNSPIAGVTYTLPVASGAAAYGQAPILKPGDITVDLSNAKALFQNLSGDICPQSFSIDFDLGRNDRRCLGSYLPDTSLTFPIEVNFSVDIYTKEFATGSMQQFLCNDTGTQSAVITVKKPTCIGVSSEIAARYELRGLRLQSQTITPALQSDPSITSLQFLGTIAGINTTGVGFFASGIS